MTTATADPPTNGKGKAASIAPVPVDIAVAVAKIHTIEGEMNEAVRASTDFIHRLILAILSRTHLIAVGEGGTVKSWAAQVAGAHFMVRVFYELFQPDTKKEQIWGPLSMKGLENDRYEHAIAGFLATADLAVLNEFKDAQAFLRQLLDAMNERIFKNGTAGVIDIPLGTVIATTNFEIEPHERELTALNDRVAQRIIQEPVEPGPDFIAILKGQIERRRGTNGKYVPKTVLTREELTAIQRAVVDCGVPDDVTQAVNDLVADARREGLEGASVRRIGDGIALAQVDTVLTAPADALKNGKLAVGMENLHVFARVLPSHSEEFTEADKLCKDFKGKVEEKVAELTKALQEIGAKLQTTRDEIARGEVKHDMTVISEVSADLTHLKGVATAAIADAVANNRAAAPIEALLAQAESEQKIINHVVLGMPL